MLLWLPFIADLNVSVLAMSAAGFGLYLCFAALTVSIHLEVEEEFRGRVGSMIGMGFSAIGPLMCFPWGHIADLIGPPSTIWVSTAIFGAGSAVLAIRAK